MKETVTKQRFIQVFNEMNRKNNFSYKGRESLYDFLIDCEEGLEEEIELDPIALCCEFTEYSDFAEFKNEHKDIDSLVELSMATTVIEIDDNSFIIENF